MAGGATTASGSYTGSDGGASTTVVITLKSNPAAVASACNSANGLQVLPIAAGTMNIR